MPVVLSQMSDSGLSRPDSPAAIASMEEDIDGYKWNGLTLDGTLFGLEKIYDYESGGYHPNICGDFSRHTTSQW